MNKREDRRIERIVEDNDAILLSEWDERFNN